MAEIQGATIVTADNSDIAEEAVITAEVPAQTVPISPSTKPRPIQVQQSQALDPSKPATTTFQEDLTHAGQRKVNLIWEYTQAAIAILVVLTTMIAGVFTLFVPTVQVGAGDNIVQVPLQIPTIIGVAFGMVTGFYFSRTNHQAIGGVGAKPVLEQQYVGR